MIRSPRRVRDRQRGNALVLAMIVLVALGALSGLTVVSVQGGLTTSTNDRFHAIATYAAESGGAAGMEFLRTHMDAANGWTAYLPSTNNSPSDILGNNVQPGVTGNPFSADQRAWYRVEIFNNKNDTGYVAGTDVDFRIVMRVTGYGPNNAMATLEWEIANGGGGASGTPCNAYAQRNISENGGGAANCLGTITNSDTGSIRPGG